MSFSNYLEEKVLNHVFGGTTYTQPSAVYCSTHTADPGETGASESTGGSYARQAITFAAASNPGGTKATSADLVFASMPASTITHVGIWDSATTGGSNNFLVGGALAASKTLNSGDTFRITSGNLTVSLD